jgi:hypothetical protein
MKTGIHHTREAPMYACIPWPAVSGRSTSFGATLARARRTARARRAKGTLAATPRVALDAPPPEVQRELDAAARFSETLAAEGKQLRFDRSSDGRISVELTDTSGHPLYALRPAEIFRLLQQGR